MEEQRIPETLEEAYRLRDEASSLLERDFYQEQVYRLRREEYRSRGIRTEISSRRRERQSAIEFSREMFFLEVAEVAGRTSGRLGGRGARAAQQEARRYATRLDTHAFLKQLASPHSGAVELYRRNYLALLRMGKSPAEAYYLSRVVGLAGEPEFRRTLESVRETGYPTRGRMAYTVEKTAIQIRDLPGGMILILLTFFASLFAFVWASKLWGPPASAGTIFFVSLGLVAAGGLMLISAVFIITFIRSINKYPRRAQAEARGGLIHSPGPKPQTPTETPLGRREWRQHFREPRSFRCHRWIAFLLFVLGLVGLLVLLSPARKEPVARASTPALDPRLSVPELPPELVVANLRDRLQHVAEQYPASYGVIVSYPSMRETVTMNPEQRFPAASLAKLPTLLTLYRAAARGEADLDAEITMRASDVQAYGTGVLYLKPVGATMTLRDCAKLMIKESDNTAWVMLHRYLGRSNIEAELYQMGAYSTEYWMPNTTTTRDVHVMLEKIADPSYTSPELSAEMLDFMTSTSFEDRLPQPLPEDARIAHKIGSYDDTFSDAGLVFPEGSPEVSDAYYMVVIVGDTDERTARSAIQDMSLATYESLATVRPTPGSSEGERN